MARLLSFHIHWFIELIHWSVWALDGSIYAQCLKLPLDSATDTRFPQRPLDGAVCRPSTPEPISHIKHQINLHKFDKNGRREGTGGGRKKRRRIYRINIFWKIGFLCFNVAGKREGGREEGGGGVNDEYSWKGFKQRCCVWEPGGN